MFAKGSPRNRETFACLHERGRRKRVEAPAEFRRGACKRHPSPFPSCAARLNAAPFDCLVNRNATHPEALAPSISPISPGKIDPVKRRIEFTRIIRGRPPVRDVSGWEGATPSERLEAVWDLTRIAMEWAGRGEPRLQRSVCRVQRSQ